MIGFHSSNMAKNPVVEINNQVIWEDAGFNTQSKQLVLQQEVNKIRTGKCQTKSITSHLFVGSITGEMKCVNGTCVTFDWVFALYDHN